MPEPEDFWSRVAASRLLDGPALSVLRRAAASAGLAAAAPAAVAAWLVDRGALTPWQARRLLAGWQGPFFLGDYRLLERHGRIGDAMPFSARHEPSGRAVGLLLLDATPGGQPAVSLGLARWLAAAPTGADEPPGRRWTVLEQAGRRFVVCDRGVCSRLADEVARLGPLPPEEAVSAVAMRLGMAAAAATGADLADSGRRPGVGGRSRSGRGVRWWAAWTGLGLAAAAVTAGFALVGRRIEERPRPPVARASATGDLPVEPGADGPASAEPQVGIAGESPDVPWASPTSGLPPSLAYLPPGAQLVLLVRPAALLADDEGRRFVAALGPAVGAGLRWLADRCGCEPGALDLVQVGWQSAGDGTLRCGCAVWLAEAAPADDAARARAWGQTTAAEIVGETVHESATLTYWVPAAEAGRVLVFTERERPTADGPADTQIVRIITARRSTADGATRTAAALPSDVELLVSALDADRHLTVFGSPRFLFGGGRPLLTGPLARLVASVEPLLDDAPQAAALSLHCGADFYVELDAVPTLDVPAADAARTIAGRMPGIAAAVDRFCAALDPEPHGRDVVLRLPAMIRVLAAHVHAAAESLDARGRIAVVNVRLPRAAAHNIALAAELALAQPFPGPGGTPAAGRDGTPPRPSTGGSP